LNKNFKRHKIKNQSDMFRIVCDPSSGSIELYLTEIIRSNLEPVVCVYDMAVWELPSSSIAYDPKHIGVFFNF
jgi:hypothetical protein